MGNQLPIGIFDSGIGGLSLLREVQAKLPSEHLIYIADTAYAPYGDKTAEVIEARAFALTQYLIEQGAKVILVACNTATVNVINLLRVEFPNIPFVGIEPAVKPAILDKNTKVVTVWATAKTATSQRLKDLVDTHYCPQTKVHIQACHGLASEIEKGDIASISLEQLVTEYLNELVVTGTDTLVLACTHYPFVLPVIEAIWPTLSQQSLTVIEPAGAVVKHLKHILNDKTLLNSDEFEGETCYLTTGVAGALKQSILSLFNKNVSVDKIEV
ncbi:glutamate racemase [Catenovulum sp. SM1970]|uniref:glutamate racemase n=1 Tax=Marinifaba aquimaris TaxID=2741323 RepID=UPI00157328DD|nr:glutamate racemase [Marinifaba aquimaris]NTS77787.1 glutamate racemase [Marinifaba aquimaris]